MSTGIKDVDRLILTELDDRSLLNICSTNKYFKNLCKDDEFWKRRYFSKFGQHMQNTVNLWKEEDESWRRKYLDTIVDLDEFSKKLFSFFDLISLNMLKLRNSLYHNTVFLKPIFLSPKRILNNFYFLNLGDQVTIYLNSRDEPENKKVLTQKYITPYTLYHFIRNNLPPSLQGEDVSLLGLQKYKGGYQAIFIF